MKKLLLLCLFSFSQMNFANKPQPITVDYLMGKFEPSQHPDFVLIESKYATKQGMYLRKEAYEAFKKMAVAAEKEDVVLTIISATRNFEYQKGIWEGKWKTLKQKNATARAKKILEYSAMPGSSRHHWGTDMDLNNLSNAFFEKNGGKKIYDWMLLHATEFGFCQPYTAGRKVGYKEEKWHWSYMPLSKKMTEFARKNMKNEAISDFSGSETAADIDVVKNYVLGINKNCL